jgi:hypothetical protein
MAIVLMVFWLKKSSGCLALWAEITWNAQKFPTFNDNGQPINVIPDATGRPSGIVEFKNYQYLRDDDQLFGLRNLAVRTNQPFTLVVNPTTRIAQPLVNAIKDIGGTIHRFDPRTGAITTF